MNRTSDKIKSTIQNTPPHHRPSSISHNGLKSTEQRKTKKLSQLEKQVKVNNWRILALDEILQSGESYTAARLAALISDNGHADYSIRTIQRDLEYMRDTLNAPIESDYRGYRYTEPNFFIKSIPLTE